MYNTVGDVAVTNIRRETNHFHNFVQYPKQTFFAFPQPRDVLRMCLNFGYLLTLRFYIKQKDLIKVYILAFSFIFL